MPIPETPLWQSLLLESPWPLCLALGLAGVIGLAVGQVTGKKAAWYAAAGLLVAAAGVWGLAAGVQTDKEKVAQLTRSILMDTEGDFDRASFESKLAADAVLTDDIGRPWLRRIAWMLAFDTAINAAGVESHHVHKLEAGAADGQAVVALNLITRTNAAGPSLHKSQWTLIWSQDGNGQWKLKELSCIGYNGHAPSDLYAYLRSPSGGW